MLLVDLKSQYLYNMGIVNNKEPQMTQTAEQKLLAKLQRELTELQESLDKFAAKFQEDPMHALIWSLSTFEQAAHQRKVKIVINALERGVSIADIKQDLTRMVVDKAKYPAQSTSPTSNLIEQYDLAVTAALLSDLEYYA